MWGGIQPGLITRLLKYGGEHVATGTFPVSACHMYASELLLRVPKVGSQRSDVIQFRGIGTLSLLLIHGKPGKHPIQGFRIGHSLHLKLGKISKRK